MTPLLKKRLSQEIAPSETTYAQQLSLAKKARLQPTTAAATTLPSSAHDTNEARRAALLHVISASKNPAAIAAADNFVHARIMAIVQRKQYQDLPTARSSSRFPSPQYRRQVHNVNAAALSASIVTPYRLSPQGIASVSSSRGYNPYTLPSLPFEKHECLPACQPATAAGSAVSPLDLLSNVSTAVSNVSKSVIKPAPRAKPAPRKSVVVPTTVHVPKAPRRPLSAAATIAATLTSKPAPKPVASSIDSEGSYVGRRNPINDLRHGLGNMAYPNGCRYVGMFFNNQRHGYGKVLYPNGLGTYTGNWQANKKNGQGIMHYANGDVYEGEWLEDRPHGVGTLTMKDSGEKYAGEFVNQKKHGRGVYTFRNGNAFNGEWRSDVKHGEGFFLCEGVWSCRQVYFNGKLLVR